MDEKNLPDLNGAQAVARLARYLREKGLAADETAALNDAFAILFPPEHEHQHEHQHEHKHE
jgi:hypothetical protein